MRYTTFGLLAVAVASLAGCEEQVDTTADESLVPVVYDYEWNERNAELYAFLFSELEAPLPDRINFLTITPMSAWGSQGDWITIPPEKLTGFPNALLYRPADEAHLHEDAVLETGTDAKAWMHWISVKCWISETEVEVEKGSWCCPLGGGASTTTYEKIDGEWTIKKTESWVS